MARIVRRIDASALLTSQPYTYAALTGDMSPDDATRYREAAREVALNNAADRNWLTHARDLRTAQFTRSG